MMMRQIDVQRTGSHQAGTAGAAGNSRRSFALAAPTSTGCEPGRASRWPQRRPFMPTHTPMHTGMLQAKVDRSRGATS
jgi:hypothetical protein